MNAVIVYAVMYIVAIIIGCIVGAIICIKDSNEPQCQPVLTTDEYNEYMQAARESADAAHGGSALRV